LAVAAAGHAFPHRHLLAIAAVVSPQDSRAARGAISHGRRPEGRSAAGAEKLLVRLVRVAGWRAKLKGRAACVCRDGYRFAKRNGKPAFHECEKPATDRHFRDLPAERARSRSDSVHRDT